METALAITQLGRGFWKIKDEWTGKAEIKTRKKFMAAAEAFVAVF